VYRVFGLVSYGVRRRTKIGIRMAVGARGRDVKSLFFREMLPIIGIGVVIGLTGALALTRLVSTLLFGVAPTDHWTIVGTGLLQSPQPPLRCICLYGEPHELIRLSRYATNG
jgi:ABC-type antimicrobial peptide transport system permease subunit